MYSHFLTVELVIVKCIIILIYLHPFHIHRTTHQHHKNEKLFNSYNACMCDV